MKTYILDRNAVACIKEQINGKVTHLDRVTKLRSIDKKNNLITSFFSIREGQVGYREDREQMIRTIKKEANALSSFYIHAKTDREFLLKNDESTAKIFSEHTELDMPSYFSIIDLAYNLLPVPLNSKKRKEAEDALLKRGKELEISLGHPIFICCLSVLYGSPTSRKILKPKNSLTGEKRDRAIYNAIADLMTVSRMNQLKSAHNEGGKNPITRFITFDEPLKIFLSKIKTLRLSQEVTSTKFREQAVRSNQQVTYDKDLFPEMDVEKYNKLPELLSY